MVPAQSSAGESEMVSAQQYQHAGERHFVRHEQSGCQRPEIPDQLLSEEQASSGKSTYGRPGSMGVSGRRCASGRAGPIPEPAARAGRGSPPDRKRNSAARNRGEQGGSSRQSGGGQTSARQERSQRR